MEKFLHGIKLTWWQAGIFKSAAVAFGIILGATFWRSLSDLMPFWWLVFIGCGSYIIYLWRKQ